MMEIRFFVPGVPAPGGSKQSRVNPQFVKAMQNGQKFTGPQTFTYDDAKRNKAWRESVAMVARSSYKGAPLIGPLSLSVTFVMPRPRYHYGTGRNARVLKPDAPKWHTTAPDTTKLLRSTEDALKGLVWVDDCLVAIQNASKLYGDEAGALVIVETIMDEERFLLTPGRGGE